MSKSSGPIMLALGAFALLMGGKSSKKSTSDSGSTGGGSTGSGGSTGAGGSSGSGGYGGSPSDSSKAKAAGGVWISPDCKRVEYEGGDPEAWWNRNGRRIADSYIAAKYRDPYEIARDIVGKVSPCAKKFPILLDFEDPDPMVLEYEREKFLREYDQVYYLIQWIRDAVLLRMEDDSEIVQFDDRCDAVFVGEDWQKFAGDTMARFYLNYAYPMESDYGFDEKAWMGSPSQEKNLPSFADNVALAVINRMHPECAWKIMQAFNQDPYNAAPFFSSRPAMRDFYMGLVDRIQYLDNVRPSDITFEPMA